MQKILTQQDFTEEFSLGNLRQPKLQSTLFVSSHSFLSSDGLSQPSESLFILFVVFFHVLIFHGIHEKGAKWA